MGESEVTANESLRNEIERDDRLQDAIFAFNVKPRTSIPLLCSAYGLPQEPKYIAHILHSTDGLLGEKIGLFFSKKENEEILEQYFMQMDLRLPFIKAMRSALSDSLRLPGEGEQIDQIVVVFARCYLTQNIECQLSSDVAYILAFAIILLNSDLHNPSNPRKMTIKQFISNLRGANLPESEMPDSELQATYYEIRDQPFAFNEDQNELLALSAPKLKGYLKKKTSLWNSIWTQHYFVLANSCIYYFKNNSRKNSDKPRGVIQLVSVEAAPGKTDKDLVITGNPELQFIKFSKRRPDLRRGVKYMILRAPSEKLREKWLYRIRTSIVISNFSNEGTNCVQNIDTAMVPESSASIYNTDSDVNTTHV